MKHALVIGQLENVSGQVLEEYSSAIKEMVSGKSGIYALYRRERLYYVGLANNLMRRLKQHQKDRHSKKWDKFSIYLTKNDEHMKELESLFLRISKPPGNKVKGKFSASENLRRNLNNLIKEVQDDRRASLMGGGVAKRRIKKKTKASRGSVPLAGLIDRRIPLRAQYRGETFRASLLKSGLISYAGEKYKSPTASARVITGRNVNGWAFWKYKDKSGEWVKLGQLRK